MVLLTLKSSMIFFLQRTQRLKSGPTAPQFLHTTDLPSISLGLYGSALPVVVAAFAPAGAGDAAEEAVDEGAGEGAVVTGGFGDWGPWPGRRRQRAVRVYFNSRS